ncbi:transporter substrate-binding domain-containing protein [Acidaminobacter hydrogenoformans]|uniref:histidine kinase n=1 Tax=Acidaminobacter hydrogenoformans DSM 2784 TaxID=1120920 RepID=A0A1G5S326_9FIRM|nr:transporter substrate-binding domain-containing protein [Acidaminobacter hydrogenoformans]SCZ80250.1 polar amino acid transport system substrate-binding protein [Acidaminobacter hydrogenoformans DSM 2784]
MKRKACLVFIILSLLALSGHFWTFGEEVDLTKETIVVGGDYYFPPFEYEDDNGVYKGFNIDIMRAIAIEKGLDLEIVPMPWYNALFALETGKIRAIQGMKFSESRSLRYDFSEPYLTSSLAIFVKSDNNYIVDLEDLKGAKVSVQKDDFAYDYLMSVGGIELLESETHEQAIDKLLSEEAVAYIGNRLTGLYTIQRSNYRDQIKITGVELLPSDYGIAVAKGDEVLLNIFNEGLSTIKRNGTYDKIYSKWFGEPIGLPESYVRNIIYFGLTIVAILTLVVILFYHWNNLLKKEVAKQTQNLVRESYYKEQTLNSIFSGLVTFNLEGKILSMNEKMVSFLGADYKNAMGCHYKETPLDRLFYDRDFDHVLTSGRYRKEVEKHYIRDGEKRILEYNMYPLVMEGNQIIGITLTMSDITEKKYLRKKLAMRAKLESLGLLVTEIAHEIRNPLTAIKTYVEILPENFEDKRFRDKIVEDLPQEINKLNRFVTELLDYARPKESQKELISVSQPIQEIFSLFSKQLEEKGIEVTLDCSENLLLYVDRQQFKQVMMNFLINAVQAVSDKKSNRKIEIAAAEIQNKVQITIEDNGHGIAKEHLERIFDPFFTTKQGGTGLGLSISYQLITENGGDVEIKSVLGEGTRVEMHFQKGQGVEKIS